MATKAISTWLFDTMNFVIRLIEFVLFGNPLSMWFFNLLFPCDAAEFANNRAVFGDRIRAYYERHALKWPFYWARWWMKLEDIGKYTVKQQIRYFFEVSFKDEKEVEALKAMQKTKHGELFWPEAYETLFFQYGTMLLPTDKIRRQTEDRRGMPWWYRRTIAEFMMKSVRLSYNALERAIFLAFSDEGIRLALKNYLASGKLIESQFKLLVDSVLKDLPIDEDEEMLNLLLDYIKRYGISSEELLRIDADYPKEISQKVVGASVLHMQTKAVKAFKNTDDGRAAWCKFCKETKQILPEVQAMMSLEQYGIFHNVGRKLDKEVIKVFLHRSDRALRHAVFVKEKNVCQDNKEIREFIRSNPALELEYRETLCGAQQYV